MKIWTSEHVFNHPWSTVTQAAWRKYPNPMNPHVQGLDVIERSVSKDGVLQSQRLMATSWGMPEWVIRIVGMPSEGLVHETSTVDPTNKTMTLKSRNLTLSSYLSFDEHLIYQQHPKDSNLTLLKQEAVIKVRGMPLSSYLENLVLGTCSTNAQKGRQAMEWVINTIKDEAADLSRVAKESMDSVKESMDTVINTACNGL